MSRSLLVCALALLLVVAAGTGAYLVGESGGKDLDEARRLGVVSGLAQGRSNGMRRGSKVGRRLGSARGFKTTYPAAYRQAYRQAFDEAGLEKPSRREIKLVAP